MSYVNIPRSNTDPFYRYKRTKLTVRVTNKNIVLVGIMKIAHEIERDVVELVQYIKYNIARPIRVSKDHIIIPNLKKSILHEDLDDVIENFIVHYVICNTCQNPETIYVKSNEKIIMSCKSCGSVNKLPQSKYLDGLRKNNNVHK